MPRYWFKAKRYGYGWTPATWEGWLVVAMTKRDNFAIVTEKRG